ncbi:hypothetical protein H2200_005413 [Cladophialophora chaetospira]|uniref:Uncharacterized protein n=1 Tax=Cladophialophora chaetospira TaxID=386627 RepID=A0AA39CJT8_9EURO|nr:hypothetical protein H2200_005413 [Cladophialophora chaetospira]
MSGTTDFTSGSASEWCWAGNSYTPSPSSSPLHDSIDIRAGDFHRSPSRSTASIFGFRNSSPRHTPPSPRSRRVPSSLTPVVKYPDKIDPPSPTEIVPFHYRRAPSFESPTRMPTVSPPPLVASPTPLRFCPLVKRYYGGGYGAKLTPTKVKYPGGFPDNRYPLWPPQPPRPKLRFCPGAKFYGGGYGPLMPPTDPQMFPPVLRPPPPSPSVISTRATKGSRFQSISSRSSSSGPPSVSPVFLPSGNPSVLSSGSSLGDTVSHCWCSPSQQSSLDSRSTSSSPRNDTAPNPVLLQLEAIARRAAAISKVPPPVSLSPASSSSASSHPEPVWFCDVPGCLNHQFRPSSPPVPIDDDNDDFAAPPGIPAESSFPQDLFQKFLAQCRAAGGRRLPSPSASPSDRQSSSGDSVSDSPSPRSLSGDDNPPEVHPVSGLVDHSFDSVYTAGDLSESPLPDSPTGSDICFRNEPTIRHYTTIEPQSSAGFFSRCGQVLDAAVSKAAAWIQSWF